MRNPAFINGSILPLLPDPVEALAQIKENSDEVITKFIGGLHNISPGDKIRWRDDVRAPLLLLETDSDRGEFYPKGDILIGNNGYSIQYVSFINRDPELVISSHAKYHIEKNPIASVGYVSYINRHATQQPVMVWHKEGRLHTPDFSEVTSETHNFSVYAEQFTRHHIGHDYLDSITIRGLKEVWEDDQYVRTFYDSYQIVLRGSRTPEEGDLTISEWLAKHCKHGFDLLADEPFQNENEEFTFLTDLAISL